MLYEKQKYIYTEINFTAQKDHYNRRYNIIRECIILCNFFVGGPHFIKKKIRYIIKNTLIFYKFVNISA